jgi:hypothetical protein
MMRTDMEIYDDGSKNVGRTEEVITLMLMSGGIFTTVAAVTQEFAPSHLNPMRGESITLSRSDAFDGSTECLLDLYPKTFCMRFCLAYLSATS